MSATSSIEWTDKTWNPVRGCSIVSPGCHSCYAMKQAHRFSGPGNAYEGLTKLTRQGPQWTGQIRAVVDALTEPLRWKKPARIFVNSMSDLFHEGVPDAFIDRVFAVMALAPQHTFQILTKRPERMRSYMAPGAGAAQRSFDAAKAVRRSRGSSGFGVNMPWPPPNVWLGVSIEDQQRADQRIPLLLKTPAAIRFVSYEPTLGPIEFVHRLGHDHYQDSLRGFTDNGNWSGSRSDAPKLDWVIVGGESGPGARPFDLAWARSVVQQCEAAGVACFVKQLGAQAVLSREADGVFVPDFEYHLTDRKGGDMEEWPEDLRVREFPRSAVAA